MTEALTREPQAPLTHVQVLSLQLATLEAVEQEAREHCRRCQANRRGTTPDAELEAARGRLFDVQDRIAVKRVALAQIEGASAQAAAAAAMAESQSAREDAAFWLRRFILSLSIANGGAFIGLASGVLQAADPLAMAAVARPALIAFAAGLIVAGGMPVAMWLLLTISGVARRPIMVGLLRLGVGLVTLGSMAAFVAGLLLALNMADHRPMPAPNPKAAPAAGQAAKS